jgi:hypothetical protein
MSMFVDTADIEQANKRKWGPTLTGCPRIQIHRAEKKEV